MNQLSYIIKSALFDFTRNKLRTFLTSLGILIGVSSVVLLLAFGLGLKAYIKNQFESLGSNLLFVIPGSFSGAGFRPGMAGTIKFDDRDLINLRKIKLADSIAGVYSKTVKVASSKSEYTDVFATTPEIFTIRNLTIKKGRNFDKSDLEKRKKVVVMGPKIAEKLFDTAENALNRVLKIDNQGFTVIGILDSKGGGGFGGPDFDSFVYIPHTAAIQLNPQKSYVTFYIKTAEGKSVEDVRSQAKEILKKRYKEDEFSVVEQTEILNTITSIFGVLNSILVAIGAISLIVGGVGIMNIMFVTVTERIKEIGVRRAIGAQKKDILFQFLAEATILSFMGGLLGLIFSFLVILAIQQFFPAYIDVFSVLIALGVSGAVGIIFGVIPAKKAADLSPIEAIRYE